MAIHTEAEASMQKGFVKKLDTSGINMVYDTLQKYQYSYPVKSTVRELLSNGIDSVLEKQTALKILRGEAKVSDFFVEKEGDLYKDSKFDPSYYDQKWLSGNDLVELTYHVGTNTTKDYVTITDHGVGLGGVRMEKYFSLGFSTKRLSKLPLGKFGLGAKSAQSLVDMYTMETCYNGRMFRFNIYSRKVDSIIPAMNMETGQRNPSIIFDPGTEYEYEVFYLPTEELNRVTISIDAKKHHKEQYLDAVKSQMLYFDNIRLQVIENNQATLVPYKAKILYEDDFIVLSDNQYYTKPHLLLNKVNYGFIDWNELELENRLGNIGIKVQPEDVDVNPSRESVLWTEQTKKMVTERFNDVVETATKMIQEELKEDDIVKWMRICYSVSGHYLNRNDTLGRLANIVDLTVIKPKFILNPKIKFSSKDPFEGMLMKFTSFAQRTNQETGETRRIVSRKPVTSLFEHFNKPVILMDLDQRASNRKDKYLLSLYPDGYVAIHEPVLTEESMELVKDEELKEWLSKMKGKLTMVRQDIWDFLKCSKNVLFYEKIDVPEDFTGKEEDEVITEAKEEVIKQVAEDKVTAAERRKQTGTTIMHTLNAGERSKELNKVTYNYETTAYYSFTKFEYPIAKINDWEEEEIYYCNNDGAELAHLVGLLTRPRERADATGPDDFFKRYHVEDAATWKNSKYWRLRGVHEIANTQGIFDYHAYDMHNFFDAKVKIIKVAQNNNHLYRDFKPITSFFIQIKDKTITMSNTLIKWNTARIIRNKLVSCSFLHNFSAFNPKYAAQYKTLCNYVEEHYRDVQPNAKVTGLTGTTVQDMIAHMDNVQRFQEFVKVNDDAETISQLARELFGNKEIRDGMAIDPAIVAAMDELEEYAIAAGDFLNHVGLLTGTFTKQSTYTNMANKKDLDIPGDLEIEIRKYLEYRGVFGLDDATMEIPVGEEELEPVEES